MNVTRTAYAVFFALATPLAVAAQGGPTDPQIAAIVVTANQVDIDAGKLAESRSSNKEVKEFAKRMVTDHSGVNKQATELVTRLKVKPEENDTSKSLKAGGDANLKKLQGLKGAEFERLTSTTRSRTTRRCSTRSTRRSFRAHPTPTSKPCSSKCARRSSPTSSTRSTCRRR